MEQPPGDAAGKALAFAQGLRRSTTTAGRRWSQWPGGAAQLAAAVACIEGIAARLAPQLAPDEASVAASIADLRAVLEWTTYQTATLATARALLIARKTRSFAGRLGLVEETVSGLAVLAESDDALIDNIRVKNGYMTAIAARVPHVPLPPPLVDPDGLAAAPPKAPGKLALIARLRAKTDPPPPPPAPRGRGRV